MTVKNEMMETMETSKEMINQELSREELENVTGGDILLGAALIGGGIAFGYGVYRSWTSCKKR